MNHFLEFSWPCMHLVIFAFISPTESSEIEYHQCGANFTSWQLPVQALNQERCSRDWKALDRCHSRVVRLEIQHWILPEYWHCLYTAGKREFDPFSTEKPSDSHHGPSLVLTHEMVALGSKHENWQMQALHYLWVNCWPTLGQHLNTALN